MSESTINAVLEEVALALENRAGNNVYKAAWRTAAKLVRSYKSNKVQA